MSPETTAIVYRTANVIPIVIVTTTVAIMIAIVILTVVMMTKIGIGVAGMAEVVPAEGTVSVRATAFATQTVVTMIAVVTPTAVTLIGK